MSYLNNDLIYIIYRYALPNKYYSNIVLKELSYYHLCYCDYENHNIFPFIKLSKNSIHRLIYFEMRQVYEYRCICGSMVSRSSNLKKHLLSRTHINKTNNMLDMSINNLIL